MNLEKIREEGKKRLAKNRLLVGMSSCGLAAGAQDLYDALAKIIANQSIDILLDSTGCIGYCYSEPTITLIKDQKLYLLGNVRASDAQEIIDQFVKQEVRADHPFLLPITFTSVNMDE